MDEKTKKRIARLESENKFLKEVIRNLYKNSLQALNFSKAVNFEQFKKINDETKQL
jgi:hypothetical protein